MRLSAARTLVAVVVLVSSVAFVSSPLWSQDVDPQSLVGDWSGTWTITPDQGKESSDVYLLKIERVEGGKVYGKGDYAAGGLQSFKLEGTLDGNRLKFGATELVIADNRMQGQSTRNKAKISLVKTTCPDSASLIGEWGGEAKYAREGGYRATYHLNITHVLCDAVWGTWEFSYERSSKGPFKGRVDGNKLTYGQMTLEIRDNQMTGGFPAWNVALSKKK